MKVSINDPEKLNQFTTIFQYLKVITDDVNLDFTVNGLYAQALGSNHVCLVEIKIDKNWFSNYTIDKSCCLGINCETFHTILSCLEKNNTFDMQYDDGDTLNIRIKCEKIEKQFEMRLLMIDVQSFDIPTVEYSADIIIVSKSFTDYINELDLFGDNLLIKCDGKDSNNVTLESSGDNGKMNLIIDEDYMEEYTVEEGIELNINYSMTYIKKMTNFVKLSKTVELHLSNEVPLKMKYNISDDETQDNYLNIYLAPKVEDD
jgi:proliferating cell nuclear antigen PCNA